MSKNTVHINTLLPDELQRVKFRLRRESETMLDTLIYLAGDVDRYLQLNAEGGPAEDIDREHKNMKLRIEQLKGMR